MAIPLHFTTPFHFSFLTFALSPIFSPLPFGVFQFWLCQLWKARLEKVENLEPFRKKNQKLLFPRVLCVGVGVSWNELEENEGLVRRENWLLKCGKC